MRIKNFTLMLMAVLFSAVGFAQKSLPARQDIAIDRLAKVLPLKQTQTVQSLTKQCAVQTTPAATPQNNPAPRAASKARAKAPEVVTPPEDGEMEYYTLTGKHDQYGSKSLTVQLIWDDQDEDVFYVSGLSYYLPEAFVKGTFKDDNTVIFENGQYLGNIYGYDLYLAFVNSKTFQINDAEVTFDDKESVFTFSDYIIETDDPTTTGYFAAWNPGVTISPLEGEPDILVEIPKDLKYEKYVAVGVDYFEDDADFSEYVNLGIYGKIGDGDVYIQGLSTDAPEAWIKGSFVDETTVAFRSGQKLDEKVDHELYFVAVDDNFDVVEEYILYYDPKTGNFEEGPYAHLINSMKDSINRSVYQFRYNYEIKPITERVAMPATSRITTVKFSPSGDALLFNLAKVDEEKEGLVDALLSYKLYYKDAKGEEFPIIFTKKDYPGVTEDMEEVPATFTDKAGNFSNGSVALLMEHRSWTEIGIQGIYYGEKERMESKITWYTPTWPITVTLPEGLTVTEHTFSGELYDSDGNTPFERTVGIAIDGDDLYIRGLGEENDKLWVKGTKNAEGAYVFPKGQSLGTYGSDYCLFLVGYDNDAASDVVVTEDGSKYTIESTFLENANYTDRSYYVNRFVTGATIFKAEAGEEVPEVVAVPEDLETETWLFKGSDYFADNDDEAAVARSVTVGFYGDDEVYVQGLSDKIPGAWVKGIIEEDEYGDFTVSFASGQYLGKYRGNDCWFIGYSMKKSKLLSYVMDFDKETSTMSKLTEDILFGVNTYKAKISGSLYEFYHTTTIKKLVERAATPVKPSVSHLNFSIYGDFVEFSIPTMDTDGEGLIDSLISYKLYYDEGDGEAKEVTFVADPEIYKYLTEDMTTIPYGFLDGVDEEGNPDSYDFGPNFVYLNMDDHDTWTRIGIQSIYSGGGETHASEIGWYTPTWPTHTELPEGAEVAVYSFSGSTLERDENDNDINVPFSKAVNVAFVENEVYIQGVGEADAEAWIKGTKDAESDVYTFAKGQMMGAYYDRNGSLSDYLFLLGYSNMFGEMDAKMTYDPETGVFTTVTDFVENADYTDNLYYLTRINAGAEIAPVNMDRPAIPETPAIETLACLPSGFVALLDIPMLDVDGVPVADSLLSYKLYYDEGDGEPQLITFTTDLYECLTADMTEIPYGFLDDVDEEGSPVGYDFYASAVYLNMDMSTWKRVGIQTIYAGGGETNESEIGWYTIIPVEVVEAPEGAEIKEYLFTGSYLSGSDFGFENVQVAFVDNEVYIKGMATASSNTWVRGVKGEDNVYTFPLGQLIGYNESWNSYIFLLGYENGVGEVEFSMTLDPETGIFTTNSFLVENADYSDMLYDYYKYQDIVAVGAQLIPSDPNDPDAIASVAADSETGVRYNVAGQRVGKNYKGIVVEKGRKILQK